MVLGSRAFFLESAIGRRGVQKLSRISGRECGECSMCCKLMEITELSKPAGTWCSHVAKRRGCTIYEARPPSCAAFECGYLFWPVPGEHWRPSKCKMVIVIEDDSRIAVHVDPSTPNIWKSQPFYSDLKEWAIQAALHDQQLIVSVARKMVALLPDCEVDLGYVAEDEVVLTGRFADGSYGARTLKADDPKIQGLEFGKPIEFR